MRLYTYYLKTTPVVWKRWIKHIVWVFLRKKVENEFPPESFWEWWADFFFYTLDILYFPLWYEGVTRFCKKSMRKLTKEELKEAEKVFGDSLYYECIRMDMNPSFGIGKDVLAFVTFFTVNYKEHLPNAIFIHELVHIWQYQNFGSVYISKALKAQRSKEGYDFGGIQRLYKDMVEGKKLRDYNFEQQAEIVETYYRQMKKNMATPLEATVMKYFGEEVKVV